MKNVVPKNIGKSKRCSQLADIYSKCKRYFAIVSFIRPGFGGFQTKTKIEKPTNAIAIVREKTRHAVGVASKNDSKAPAPDQNKQTNRFSPENADPSLSASKPGDKSEA